MPTFLDFSFVFGALRRVRTVQTRLLCVIDGLLLQFSITKHLNKTNYSVVATAIAMVCLPPAAAVLHRHVFEEECGGNKTGPGFL